MAEVSGPGMTVGRSINQSLASSSLKHYRNGVSVPASAGPITSVNITNAGTGYTSITSVNITNAGTGYTSMPLVHPTISSVGYGGITSRRLIFKAIDF